MASSDFAPPLDTPRKPTSCMLPASEFDQFASFEDRGERFRAIVEAL